MSTIQITQFTTSSADTLQQILSALDQSAVFLGTKIRDHNNVQLISPASDPLPSALGSPLASYTISFNAPFFGPNNPGSAPIIENVLITFPKSRMTSKLRTRVESDFATFDMLAKKEMSGDIGLAYGWVEGPLRNKSFDGEGVGFFVVRGWETMRDFENVLKTSGYTEGVPLLMAWEAPFEMWHTERVTAQ